LLRISARRPSADRSSGASGGPRRDQRRTLRSRIKTFGNAHTLQLRHQKKGYHAIRKRPYTSSRAKQSGAGAIEPNWIISPQARRQQNGWHSCGGERVFPPRVWRWRKAHQGLDSESDAALNQSGRARRSVAFRLYEMLKAAIGHAARLQYLI
jgi:hypothetical protein